MYLLENLLVETLKVMASLGVAGFLATLRRRKKPEQPRYAPSDMLLDALKIVASVAVGALLGAWRERKRNEKARQELTQLRQSIGEDIQQALAQWSAHEPAPAEQNELAANQAERPADQNEIPFEPLVVSSRQEA